MYKAVLLLAVFLVGCAQLQQADCGKDAYGLGERDGRLGATPQGAQYANACGNFDGARYMEGWREGYDRRPRPVV